MRTTISENTKPTGTKNHPLYKLFDFLFHRCAFGSHHPQRRFRNARSGIRLDFVIYYIIDSGATRVAKSGEMNIVLGVWMSTIVLAPIGAFFTYKSNNDSVVFNAEVYINFFRMLLGLRPSRHVFKKKLL